MKKLKLLGRAGKAEINLMRWERSDANPGLGVLITDQDVVDIRIWKDDVPANGVCLCNDAVIAFLFHCAAYHSRNHEIRTGTFGNKDFYIYELIATLHRINGMVLLFTRCSFGEKSDNPGYDLRYWDDDITKFTRGIHLCGEEFQLVGQLLVQYLDEEGISFPNWNLQRHDGTRTIEDQVADLAVQLDRSYLIGNQNKITTIAERIRELILAE